MEYKRKLQIDVLEGKASDINMMRCNIYIGDRCVTAYISKVDYKNLIKDGLFIRDGKEKDSAGVINTTKVFIENKK